MSFQLVQKSVTLNGILALILRYFSEFDRLGGWLHQSGWRQTYKVQCRISTFQLHFGQNWPKQQSHSHGLFATVELLVFALFFTKFVLTAYKKLSYRRETALRPV